MMVVNAVISFQRLDLEYERPLAEAPEAKLAWKNNDGPKPRLVGVRPTHATDGLGKKIRSVCDAVGPGPPWRHRLGHRAARV